MTGDNPIEMLDLVDNNDTVISSMERNEVYANKLNNFRVINGFIKNSEGKLFIPRRQKNKRLFPLALDVSVGGHVTSGETYEEAFAKETAEELNVDIYSIPFKILGTMNPHTDNVSAFMTVYEIQSDLTPAYNPDDFIEHYWLTPEEILLRIENGDSAKGDLPKLIKKFYL